MEKVKGKGKEDGKKRKGRRIGRKREGKGKKRGKHSQGGATKISLCDPDMEFGICINFQLNN